METEEKTTVDEIENFEEVVARRGVGSDVRTLLRLSESSLRHSRNYAGILIDLKSLLSITWMWQQCE